MSVKFAGDLNSTNVSSRLGDPVETSVKLYEKIEEFLNIMALDQRYGKIDYVIVKGKTKVKLDNYIDFVSLKDNLQNFHFDGLKVKIQLHKEDNNIKQTKIEAFNKRSQNIQTDLMI
ncbi:unnamed protein product [Brachionus calyciflorus]|uniref:Uncharacterized protein n=1 Tax=Brachionus calyciflorus TaxID=104777 RepID=A0A814HWE8_9BILA|nr:unnamed protein product [Brachionus calyciflorus]